MSAPKTPIIAATVVHYFTLDQVREMIASNLERPANKVKLELVYEGDNTVVASLKATVDNKPYVTSGGRD